MQIDATSISAGVTLEADVAIVGAGPAGITLALELADAGHHVVLIESGGEKRDAHTQHLGETVGYDPAHAPMSLATRRQIGGTSNVWGGRCVPFDPVDFRARAIVRGARWPVTYAEIARYFPRACEWCRCGRPVFDANQIPCLADNALIPGWPEGDICSSTSLERWSLPTNFGRLYRQRLKDSAFVRLITKLTCTEIVCTPDGRGVAHLNTRTLSGKSVLIKAMRYVLACGGVESTRLLFASNGWHESGIGNHSGHLGRWYMAHVRGSIAEIQFSTPPASTTYGFERDADGVYVRRRLTFSSSYLLEHELPNIAMWLDNPELSDPSHGSAALSCIYLALASPLGPYLLDESTRRAKLHTKTPASVWPHVWNVMRRLPTATLFATRLGYERFVRRGPKAPGIFEQSDVNTYRLFYHGEHLPHRDSFIMPSGDHDALGVPRVRTRLSFQDDDIMHAIRVHEHLDAYLRRRRLGRLNYLYDDLESGFREQQLREGYHQIGTTRMSARPEDGVLDSQLAVHGFGDLFVASSSAFPTSSQANSTFMIVVCALRLADHLNRSLSPVSVTTA
jgi:hypothetical protein